MNPLNRRVRKLEADTGGPAPTGRALIALIHAGDDESAIIAALGAEPGDEIVRVIFVRPGESTAVLH